MRQLQGFKLTAVQLQAQVALQEPFVEQPGIALQQGLAERPHALGNGDLLQADQLREGGIEPRVGVGVIDVPGQGRAAEIFQQQEALLLVAGQHARYANAGGFQQVMHAQPRAYILQPWRRIHHDMAAVHAGGTPVAAEAGVHRGPVQVQVGVAQRGAGPLSAKLGAQRVGSRIVHGQVRRSGALRRSGIKGGSAFSACC